MATLRQMLEALEHWRAKSLETGGAAKVTRLREIALRMEAACRDGGLARVDQLPHNAPESTGTGARVAGLFP